MKNILHIKFLLYTSPGSAAFFSLNFENFIIIHKLQSNQNFFLNIRNLKKKIP